MAATVVDATEHGSGSPHGRGRSDSARHGLGLDWRWLATRAALATLALIAVSNLYATIAGGNFAADFHWGIWTAGSDFLHGRSPYPPPDPHRLLLLVHGFITPPPLALVAVPFSQLPFAVAVVTWELLCVAALCLALWLMGVADWRVYVLALLSVPMIDSLQNGQPDALFALGAAITWRYRDSWPGGVAAGALIAAKLLAWPLAIWMLVMRRFRSLAITAVTTVVLLVGSWACIGFSGLAQYPRLLAADARAFETWPLSHALAQALAPLGLSTGPTRILAVFIALAFAATIVALARRRDEGWFAGALVFGLLSSPILWAHYLVVLLVPLAFARGRQPAIWIALFAGFWLTMLAVPSSEGRAIAVPVLMTALLIWAVASPDSEETAAGEGGTVCEGTGIASSNHATGTMPIHANVGAT